MGKENYFVWTYKAFKIIISHVYCFEMKYTYFLLQHDESFYFYATTTGVYVKHSYV